MDAGEELRGVERVVGDAVAMGVRDTVDEPAVFESTQVQATQRLTDGSAEIRNPSTVA